MSEYKEIAESYYADFLAVFGDPTDWSDEERQAHHAMIDEQEALFMSMPAEHRALAEQGSVRSTGDSEVIFFD